MLRAAYFGQELLSTFGTTIGEVALIPATGGIFQVSLTYEQDTTGATDGELQPAQVLIWDRKTEGGFPETKILKQLIRNHIDPAKNLGHSDTASKSKKAGAEQTVADLLDKQAEAPMPAISAESGKKPEECTDCA